MPTNSRHAPGRPGMPQHWSSGGKAGVGAALNPLSRVWFTVNRGIVEEVCYPRLDVACIRDFELIVTDENVLFAEEKIHARHELKHPADGSPAYLVVNTHERFRIEKEVIADPRRNSVLQLARFVPLRGGVKDYRLYALMSPHLGNRGGNNTAWLGEYHGIPMLYAAREGLTAALACSSPFLKRSVGYAGISDGRQDLIRHKRMTWEYDLAEHGNVVLTAEIDLNAPNSVFLLAAGFGSTAAEAGYNAASSLLDGFASAEEQYLREWKTWLVSLSPYRRAPEHLRDLSAVSAAVMRTHESKQFPGAVIAGSSIPWAFARPDGDTGGYHLVWTSGLTAIGGGLLAAGAREDARRVVNYLQVTQEADGHWPQNMHPDGQAFWNGVQLEETALAVLLADLARRERVIGESELPRYWPMVRSAAGYIVRNGPVGREGRWEEDPGYSPFTLAVEIAALLAASEFADTGGEKNLGAYFRETADAWNENIERWTCAVYTGLDDDLGVKGYYVHVAPAGTAPMPMLAGRFQPLYDLPGDPSGRSIACVVSTDALALVRLGLRAPDDPRILDTVRVIDALLKKEMPYGPVWRRYSNDGYGEHADGAPFDGTGIGRAWPVITAERALFELAAGRRQEAERLLRTVEAAANEGGMLPEQVWDQDDIAHRNLFLGKPTGSATPLVRAHAEYVKLLRSLNDGRLFDRPPQTWERYVKNRTAARYASWRFNNKARGIPAGRTLRIEVVCPAIVRWTRNGWQTSHDASTRYMGMGMHVMELPTDGLGPGSAVEFTFFWPACNKWEGENYAVRIETAAAVEAKAGEEVRIERTS